MRSWEMLSVELAWIWRGFRVEVRAMKRQRRDSLSALLNIVQTSLNACSA